MPSRAWPCRYQPARGRPPRRRIACRTETTLHRSRGSVDRGGHPGFSAVGHCHEAIEPTAAGPELLTRLGNGYIDFGSANPALFDLRFRTVELHAADPELLAAQTAAMAPLIRAAGVLAPQDPVTLATLAWALVHGLVVLTRDGALRNPTNPTDPAATDDPAATELTRQVIATLNRLVTRREGPS